MAEVGDTTKVEIGVRGRLTEGENDFYRKLATRNPQTKYIVIGPQVPGVPERKKSFLGREKKDPNNLTIINWESTEESGFPFTPDSADVIYLTTVYGSMASQARKRASSDEETQEARDTDYIKLVNEARTALKTGGSLRIVEPTGIASIGKFLDQAGFSNIVEKPLTDDSVQTDYIRDHSQIMSEWIASK